MVFGVLAIVCKYCFQELKKFMSRRKSPAAFFVFRRFHQPGASIPFPDKILYVVQFGRLQQRFPIKFCIEWLEQFLRVQHPNIFG